MGSSYPGGIYPAAYHLSGTLPDEFFVSTADVTTTSEAELRETSEGVMRTTSEPQERTTS